MSITFTPNKDGVCFSSQDIKNHNSGFGTGAGKTTSLPDIFFRGIKKKSPARATYCKRVLKSCGSVQLPRGCNF